MSPNAVLMARKPSQARTGQTRGIQPGAPPFWVSRDRHANDQIRLVPRHHATGAAL